MKQMIKIGILGLALAASSSALADDLNGGNSGGYLGVFAGASFANQTHYSGSNLASRNQTYDAGYAGSVRAGYLVAQGLGLEVQAGLLNNGNGDLKVSGGNRNLTSNTQVWDGMANVVYNFNNSSPLVPVMGAGAGIAGVDHAGHDSAGNKISGNSTNFAYQGIVGVGYKMDNNWTLGIRYTYFATNSGKYQITDANGSTGQQNASFRSNLLGIDATYAF